MFTLRFVSFSFALTVLTVYQYVMMIAIAGVLLGLSSNVILSIVSALIISTLSTMFIAPPVFAISEVVVEKASFTASKVCRFFREKKEEFEAYRFNKANGFSLVRS